MNGPSEGTSRRAPFLDVHQVEERHQIIAVRQPGFFLAAEKAWRAGVAPTALLHEGVPDFDLLGIGSAAGGEAALAGRSPVVAA